MFVGVGVSVASVERPCGVRDGHDQPPVLYAFQANEAASELLDLVGFAVHDENFEAGIVIEMCVGGRDN